MAVEEYDAPVRITDLKLEYISPEKEIQMRPSIYAMLMDKKVDLDYSYNSFSVTFESINYRFQHDIAYQYILEGYENHGVRCIRMELSDILMYRRECTH